MWNDPERATKISKEKSQLDNVIGVITALDDKLEDAKAMIDLAVEADDATLLADVQAELDEAEAKVADLEFKRMFSGEMDANNAATYTMQGINYNDARKPFLRLRDICHAIIRHLSYGRMTNVV